MDRYGSMATIIVMSDHGFANFGRQFNLNSWLRNWGYLGPPECTSIMTDVDWSQTVAYGLGINGLYLNMKGRERDGIVEPGDSARLCSRELIERLEAVTDANGQSGDPRRVSLGQDLPGQRDRAGARLDHRLSPRLPRLVGHDARRADRRGPARQRPWPGAPTTAPTRSRCPACSSATARSAAQSPSLVDLAPSILAEFGLPAPPQMVGKNVLSS